MTFVLAARRQIGYALGRAAGGLSWLLRDDFTTDLPAGSVNGTAAEPGPGTRVVVDTANKLWLESGKLQFALRDPHISGDPGLWLSEPIQRIAGRMAIFDIPINYSNFWVGWDSNLSSVASHTFYWYNALRIDSVFGPVVQSTALDAYVMAITLRDNGAFYFRKQPAISNSWLLSWIKSDGSVSPLYITVSGYNHAPAVSRIGVPNEVWLPTPLASDGFGSTFGTTDGLGHAEGIAGGIGAGGGGVAWSNVGGTWSVSGGKAINTPTLGTNILINSGFDTDTTWIKGATWSIAAGVATKSGAGDHLIYQGATSYKWRRISFDVTTNNGNIYAYSGAISNILTGTGTKMAIMKPVAGVGVGVASTATSVVIDNVVAYDLVLAELLSMTNTACADVMVSAAVTFIGVDKPVGLATNWDSVSSPTNGVVVVLSGYFVQVLKCVSGVWSGVSSTSFTYSAGTRLVVAKSATKYRVYYNNAFIVEATISDASIVNNTLHGIFSTDAGNTLDNYTCYATGTGGEYATLDQYIQ